MNGVMYTLAEKTPVLEQEDGQLVLRAWNIHSNSYRDIPLITEDGAQPQIGLDHITSSEGSVSRDGSHYRWVAWEDGKVRSVNLTSGVVRELFTLDLSHYNSGESKFFFTDTSVFVLDVNAKRDELKFSHYIASLTARKQTTSLLKASPMWIGYECHAISSETSPLTPHGSRCTTAEGIFGTLALSPVSAPPYFQCPLFILSMVKAAPVVTPAGGAVAAVSACSDRSFLASMSSASANAASFS